MSTSFRSYSNGRSHNRRSPSSAPSTRSSSYHSPTRAVALNSTSSSSNSRPSSPALSTRHSTHGSSSTANNSDSSIISNRSSPQSPSPHSALGSVPGEQPPASQQQLPAHHRTNSGPTIAINLFSEPEPNSCEYKLGANFEY